MIHVTPCHCSQDLQVVREYCVASDVRHKTVVQPTTEILIITSTLVNRLADRVTHNLAMQLNRLKLAINHRVYNKAADICSPRMCMEIVEDITRILRVLVEEFERWRFNFRRARVRRLKALWRMRNSLTRSCSALYDINVLLLVR